jgi:hypothetical protein
LCGASDWLAVRILEVKVKAAIAERLTTNVASIGMQAAQLGAAIATNFGGVAGAGIAIGFFHYDSATVGGCHW